ncbi:sensor histidine kinase [Paenibacillus xanthanilyticus]|uniref:Sensor histidine kinase n=1 Tax=Paenibacillus xanthanilyticus TaxID=1783531 RepID=A0ABV8JX77_9BACL
MKIRTKLIAANLFIVLFLLGSLSYVFLKRSTDMAYETIMENNLLSLSQVGSNLDNKLQSYEEIANTLFLNSALDAAVEAKYDDLRDAYREYFNYYQPFVSAVQTTKDIYHLYQYTTNPMFVFSNVFLIDDEIAASEWYKATLSSRIGGHWTAPYPNPVDKEPLFSFRKRMNNFNPASERVVSVEIKLKVLRDLVSEESKSKRFLFLYPDGTMLVDTALPESAYPAALHDVPSAAVPAAAPVPGLSRILAEESGDFAYEDGKDTYRILFKTLTSRNAVKGMKVVAFVPVTELMPKIEQLRTLAIVLFVIAFAASALLISLISVGLTRRLTELAYRMKRLHKDNFESFVEVRGRDEVAQLGEMFNFMVRRLRELIGEVYQSELNRKENELRTKEVELYALQTQINPHFLFNVLNMIRGKLLIAGDRENAKVVGLLAKSFRMMLKRGGPTITLAEELEFIDIYLQIQQYRFGDKFAYEIAIDAGLQAIRVPKLCIQPLVENAVTHGVELHPERSTIWIKGEVEGGKLLLTVGDDGLGIQAERLAEIRGWLEETDGLASDKHIGLRNVHRRLRQMYGDGYGLTIESEIGLRTEITMTIPLDHEGGERDA